MLIYLELAVPHDCTRKLGIQILLVLHARTKALLAQHFAKRSGVIIRIIPNNLTCLWVVGLELRKPMSKLFGAWRTHEKW